jgi:hypothetical protein
MIALLTWLVVLAVGVAVAASAGRAMGAIPDRTERAHAAAEGETPFADDESEALAAEGVGRRGSQTGRI